MKMVFRWWPNGDDTVTLAQIRQIPGVSGVATMFSDIPAGEVWPRETILALRDQVHEAGLEMEVIESVNVHEDIKKGLASRDEYISNYITTMKNLHEAGVKCICYNLMPVMDWFRSQLEMPLSDGSFSMAYEHAVASGLTLESIIHSMLDGSQNMTLPGWEPERFPAMAKDIEFYQNVSAEEYFRNITYFLDAIMPYAEEYDIDFGVHPDDPPLPLFGLPKVINNAESIRTFLNLNSSNRNGLTLCTGSLGANLANDIPAMAREFCSMGRVPFVHLRNIKHTSTNDFHESAHLSTEGDLDMFEIVRALYESGFDGYIRPDHGRRIWDEVSRPGYGLYDRALGASYIEGLWEAVSKCKTSL
ncbi:MAG: mannonate dehydratase [Clostridiales bacterium]|nr:mannonate dehydratase [Clostridiales bacterium]